MANSSERYPSFNFHPIVINKILRKSNVFLHLIYSWDFWPLHYSREQVVWFGVWSLEIDDVLGIDNLPYKITKIRTLGVDMVERLRLEWHKNLRFTIVSPNFCSKIPQCSC